MPQSDPESVPDYFPDDPPLFFVGQVVRHRRYGYRGVIVDFDMRCLADETWYQHNRTQPSRDQAWYHVLVDRDAASTYAAQENLINDNTTDPVEHPHVDRFFSGFDGSCYERNDTPWPSW